MGTKDTVDLLKVLIGKDKIMAANLCKQSGLTPRLRREDKDVFIVTKDFKLDRVNLEYDDGLVTNAWLG